MARGAEAHRNRIYLPTQDRRRSFVSPGTSENLLEALIPKNSPVRGHRDPEKQRGSFTLPVALGREERLLPTGKGGPKSASRRRVLGTLASLLGAGHPKPRT